MNKSDRKTEKTKGKKILKVYFIVRNNLSIPQETLFTFLNLHKAFDE